MEEFIINQPSDLLNGKALAALSPAAKVAYNEAAAAFVRAWNDANPNGVAVKASITKVKLTDEGAIVVIAPHVNLSNQSFSFPYVVMDAIAADLGVATADGLAALTLSTLEPNFLTSTVKAVAAGDTFIDKDKVKHVYKQAQMVKVDGTREEIVLSADSKALVAEQQQELLKDEIRKQSANRRNARTGRAARVGAPGSTAVETDEADV